MKCMKSMYVLENNLEDFLFSGDIVSYELPTASPRPSLHNFVVICLHEVVHGI